jgi:predicted amidohydrolase YtcJ
MPLVPDVNDFQAELEGLPVRKYKAGVEQMKYAMGQGVSCREISWSRDGDRAFPMRTMIDIMGLNAVAQGTDYPINLLSPFVNIYVMVTRRDRNGAIFGKEERITREEAIRLYTSSAARYSFSEHKTGSIEPGKYADMVLLSDDILAVSEGSIKDIIAVRTIVEGRTVFEQRSEAGDPSMR